MARKKSAHMPFRIKDCTLNAIATGLKAQNLKELRDLLRTVDPGSIYYHFWGGLLRPRFDDPEYPNDFASWAHHALHDKMLAEKLAMVDPTEFEDIDQMRRSLLDIIEEQLDAAENVPWTRQDQQFHFITSQIVVFDTHRIIKDAEELVTIMPHLTSSSVFYHFIDARRRTFGHIGDFSTWLYGFNDRYVDLCDLLGGVDPYFSTLPELRSRISTIVCDYFRKDADGIDT